jgi:sugar phosphate isomerase/epimerase
MQYGTMNFPVKPTLQEIRRIASLGFDFLELTLDAPQAHFAGIREQKDLILDLLQTSGLGLVCHLPTFVYTADLTESIRRASLQEMLSALETAAELSAEKVVLHPGFIGGMGAFVMDLSLKYAMTSLERIYRRALDLGMVLCFENMFPRYLSFVEPKDFQPVFDEFPQLMLTLDTGHANINDAGKDRALRFIELFAARLGHVHMSDNQGKKDDHLPVGQGSVPFRRIVRALQRAEYDGTVTLEIFTEDSGELVASRERIKALLRH